MAYCIKDEKTERVLRELAELTGKSIADCLREICASELARERGKGRDARLDALSARLRRRQLRRRGGGPS